MLRPLSALVLLAFAVVAACSDPNAIPSAYIENDTTTVVLASLERGTVTQPTAYSMTLGSAVRTWEVGTDFDFLFSMDPQDKTAFLPLASLGLATSAAVKPGLLRTTTAWDAMTKAPLNGYVTLDSVPIAEQDRFYLRTAVSTCVGLGVPLYGKLQILDIDTAAGTVKFLVLSDQNCGYRGLALGIPKQ
jgi:hypothetical protein